MMFAWLTLQTLLVLAAVQVVGAARSRLAASAALSMTTLLLPLIAPVPALVRALMASLTLLAVLKVLQIARQAEGWSPRERTWHALMPFDVRNTQRVGRSFDRRLALTVALHATAALLALLVLFLLPRDDSLGAVLARWALGLGMVYSGVEAIVDALRLVHRLWGVSVPAIQRLPLASRSLAEFWNSRWNRSVSGWLSEFVFRPVASRFGRGAGVFAAFTVSAAAHAWVFYCAVGARAALMAGAFFLLHGALVLVEAAIGIRAAAPVLQRAWTLGLLGASSPLFVEPVLQVFGV